MCLCAPTGTSVNTVIKLLLLPLVLNRVLLLSQLSAERPYPAAASDEKIKPLLIFSCLTYTSPLSAIPIKWSPIPLIYERVFYATWV